MCTSGVLFYNRGWLALSSDILQAVVAVRTSEIELMSIEQLLETVQAARNTGGACRSAASG